MATFPLFLRKIVASGNCKKFAKTLQKQRKNSRLVDVKNTTCVWQISHQQKGKKLQNEFLTKFFAIWHQKKKSHATLQTKIAMGIDKNCELVYNVVPKNAIPRRCSMTDYKLLVKEAYEGVGLKVIFERRKGEWFALVLKHKV